MTGVAPSEYPALDLTGGADSRAGRSAEASAAAAAAAPLVPASTPLTAGTPTESAAGLAIAGQAVCARFAGAAEGEIVVVVAQDLVDALKNSPLGELDLTKAIQPALTAAVGTFGPVVLDPAKAIEPQLAFDGLAGKGTPTYVPLADGESVAAVLAIVVTNRPGVPKPQPRSGTSRGMDLLHGVEMEVTAELGRTRMTVRDLLSLAPGAIVELDRAAGSPADLLVNGRLIACGEVVVIDENFGLRITEIMTTGDRG